MPQEILRRRAVEKATGLSRSTLYLLMTNGQFPRPIKLGPRAVGWLATEISDWQATRARSVGEPAQAA